MEYGLDELLDSLLSAEKDTSTLKTENFSKAICYFSNCPNDVLRILKTKTLEEKEIIYEKLFVFLPITKDIIKLLEKEVKLFEEMELKIKNEYFSKMDEYIRFLEGKELEINKLENEVNEIQKNINRMNKDKEERNRINSKREKDRRKKEELLEKLVGKTEITNKEEIKKLKKRVDRFYKKLTELEGMSE